MTDNPLEKCLAAFARDKSGDNYVRLLYAFRYTDVLVTEALPDGELPLFGNQGIVQNRRFVPDIIPYAGKMLMPVYSEAKEIPANRPTGKAVYMHCRDWIKASRQKKTDGAVLNPFSELSFILTRDQIKVLLSFPEV